MRRTPVVVLFILCLFGLIAPGHALINPKFTPIQLVKQSKLIVSVDLKQGKSINQYDAVIREVLKGKTEMKAIHLDLSKARDEQDADSFRKLAAAGAPALFFVGELQEQSGGAAADGNGRERGGWCGGCLG